MSMNTYRNLRQLPSIWQVAISTSLSIDYWQYPSLWLLQKWKSHKKIMPLPQIAFIVWAMTVRDNTLEQIVNIELDNEIASYVNIWLEFNENINKQIYRLKILFFFVFSKYNRNILMNFIILTTCFNKWSHDRLRTRFKLSEKRK